MAMGQSEKDRFRSFAERYVVARADRFDPLDPRRDAWAAIQDAVSIYQNIEQVGQAKFSPVSTAGLQDAVAGVDWSNPPRTRLPHGVHIRVEPPDTPEWEQGREHDMSKTPEQVAMVRKGLIQTLTEATKGALQHGKKVSSPKGTKKAV